MISYKMEFDGELKEVEVSREDLLQQLGPAAAPADAEQFEKVWQIRFAHMREGMPTFDTLEDFEAAFASVRETL